MISILRLETVFQKRFCGHRWLENGPVLIWFLKMIDLLEQYVTSLPNAQALKNFCLLLEVLSNAFQKSSTKNLLCAHLEFCRYVAEILEPFLRKFQLQQPLAPFLYEEISSILRALLQSFVKPCFLSNSADLTKIDFNDEKIFKPSEQMLIGIGSKARLKNMTPSQSLQFRSDCRKILVTVFQIARKITFEVPADEADFLLLSWYHCRLSAKSGFRMTSLLEVLHQKRYTSTLSSVGDKCS